MITGELKNKVDAIWDTLWTSGITSPITVLEQITYLNLNYSWCVHDASKSDIANKLSTIPRFLSEVCLEIGEISPWCWLFSKLFEQNFGIVKVQPFSDAYSSCGSASLWMFSNVVMNSF